MPPSTRGLLRSTRPWIWAVVFLAACSTRVVPPPEPPSSVRRGDEAFHYRDYDNAISNYRSYLDQTESGAYTVRVFYKSALAAYRLGRYHDTLTTLDELKQRYPDAHWVQVEGLRGDAELGMGNVMRALQAWDAGWKIGTESDHQKLRQRIVAAVRNFNGMELARARRLVTTKDVVRLLDQEIAKRKTPPDTETVAEDEGDLEELAAPETPPDETSADTNGGAKQRPASKPTTTAKPPAKAPRAATGIEGEPLDAGEVLPPDETPAEATSNDEPIHGAAKVGCLLPLTGPARDFGQHSLRGIRLAFGEHGPPLALKDTGNDPALAVSALDDLSRDANVLAVIGPLRSDHAEAVAPEAENSGLPLFLLSQRDGLKGQFLVQVGMTRSRLVGTLLDYAMEKVRLRRFGVLYPDDAFGKEFLSSFRAEAERRGGQVVGSEAYPAGKPNWGSQVGTLRKWRDGQNLQAIFLPDGATSAAGFAGFLQREMPDVTLLGPYGWEELADHGDAAGLNGVLFTDGFYAGSARPATREFVEHFAEVYGERPSIVEAQAYDAALLIKRALDAGARSRADVLRRLRAVGPLEGVTGDLQVTPAGLKRSMFLLQVYDGKLQEIIGSEG